MTHREKVARYLAEVETHGLSASTAAPPAYRLLWRLGVRVPPPPFQEFFSLAVMYGVLFSVPSTAIVYLAQWPLHFLTDQYRWVPWDVAIAGALPIAALFGVPAACLTRWHFHRLRLPPWEDYPLDPYDGCPD